MELHLLRFRFDGADEDIYDIWLIGCARSGGRETACASGRRYLGCRRRSAGPCLSCGRHATTCTNTSPGCSPKVLCTNATQKEVGHDHRRERRNGRCGRRFGWWRKRGGERRDRRWGRGRGLLPAHTEKG